uniref:Ribonuclease H-like domain-containing protein n=1 Tax=Tanacetum cinerariifolium TaxID=118510 RepID=A0A6L2JJ43_TANCI|nr:ribonuclease H-like domain-containing protein [Tanacetum cinerariifolium]
MTVVNGEKGTSRSHNNTHKSFTPRPAIHRPYRPTMRSVRQNMTVAQPKRTSFHKPAHSYNKRPFQRTSVVRSQFRDPRVAIVNRKFTTVNRKLPTINRKFPTGNTKFSTADMGNKGKAGSSQNNIDDKGFWDSGCSRHMTSNISYLFDYEPFDEGYVSFGQGGCKITGKGTIKTGKLEFENVYFVKDLKTLIEAARTMLVDAKLPVTFWAKAVNTACYVQNRVLVNKSQNKTPYELFNDTCKADAPESSGNPNPTASTTNLQADPIETLAVETLIPTVSSPIPTACLNDSQEPSNILGVTTNLVDLDGVEADVNNMETTITSSPTPTLRIHKDYPKS